MMLRRISLLTIFNLVRFDSPWEELGCPVLHPFFTLLLPFSFIFSFFFLRLILLRSPELPGESLFRLLLLRHVLIIIHVVSLEVHHSLPGFVMVLEEAIIERLKNSTLIGHRNIFGFSNLFLHVTDSFHLIFHEIVDDRVDSNAEESSAEGSPGNR